ncbi:MAG: redoxin domain-containing protein [Candidatus Saccharibacteria bacterium]
MRNLLTALLVTFLFLSCKSSKDEFSIKGTIAGVETGKVYLQKVVEGRPESIDTANVVDGKFSFTGKMETPDMRVIRLNDKDYIAQLFLDNSKVTIVAKKDSMQAAKITGSPSQDLFQTYMNEVESMNKQMGGLQDRYQKAMAANNADEIKKVQVEYQAIMDNMKVFTKNFVKEHNTSVVAAYIALFQLSDKIESAELDSIVNGFPQEISKSEYVVSLKKIADGMRKTAVGKEAPDFTMNDPQGKPIQLSSLRGKVVMIDFWASWCGPCRQENPNVVKLYQQYHDKGFEILGVSLDRTKEDWEKAIKDDQLSWLHVSDLQYWQNSAAQLYAVNAIPQTYLLDQQGKIIAKGLRSEELAAKLMELFPNQK